MAHKTRADDNGPFKEFDFEAWVDETVEEVKSTFEEYGAKYRNRKFDASEFQRHIRNAQKEQLLAIRSLLDSAIEFVDPDKDKAREQNKA